jgi:hypothetical protein
MDKWRRPHTTCAPCAVSTGPRLALLCLQQKHSISSSSAASCSIERGAGSAAQPEPAVERATAAAGSSRRGKRQQQPQLVAPDVARFLTSKGLDVGRLEAALPLRTSQLTLSRVRDTWRLLRREHGMPAPDAAALLQKVPQYLTADVEAKLRPKLELLSGVPGPSLARLLSARPNLAYTTVEQLRPVMARLEHYLGAAAAARLLPETAAAATAGAGSGLLLLLLAARPGSWAEALTYSPNKLEASHAALIKAASMDDAQFGAALAGA